MRREMSGQNDWLFRIQDMIDNIHFIQNALENYNEDNFMSDEIMQRAVARSYEILGEAARFVPKSAQERYNDISWHEIIGLRNKIAHDYLDVDIKVLWYLYEKIPRP